ncbi:MAG: PIN domain-containing protein [Ornithinimicrobium sp.]
MIVLDASFLIAFLDSHDAHHHLADEILATVLDEPLGANSLTMAEVLVGPIRGGKAEAARRALDDLDIQELSFPPDTAVKLAHVRASTGLKMPDCCVLLAAEESQADIASFDDALAYAARQRNFVVHSR